MKGCDETDEFWIVTKMRDDIRTEKKINNYIMKFVSCEAF